MPLRLYATFTVTLGSDALPCQLDDIVEWAVQEQTVVLTTADGRTVTYEFDPRGDTSNDDFVLTTVECVDTTNASRSRILDF